MSPEELLRGLPGGHLVVPGLADYQAGRESVGALLVAMAAGRFRQAGLLPAGGEAWDKAEIRLYRLLERQFADSGGDVYARYNSLRRELDSFLAALGQRLARL